MCVTHYLDNLYSKCPLRGYLFFVLHIFNVIALADYLNVNHNIKYISWGNLLMLVREAPACGYHIKNDP